LLTITRSFQFCAGHRLYRPDWDQAKNLEVFGLCSNPAGHGHNYSLEVSVTGPLDQETGMIMNLRQLKEVVTQRVVADVDHKNLNVDVPWMRGIIPTTEQFAEQIWTRIASLLQQIAPQVILEEIVLHETPNNRVRKQRS